jgi:hypothetical protein
MSDVRTTSVDGVTCFWVNSGRPTLAASLIFRQGMVDEPLYESGWLHLVEHLALHGRSGGTLSVNGSVSLLETSFDAHGPADQVAKHFGDLSAWLSQPSWDDLSHERDVLAAETAYRGRGPVERALGWRYGARGPGVINYGEPGLSRASIDGLARRAGSVFTAGNAVLVLDGPPPPGLSLHLPEGVLHRPTTAVPCDDELPAMYVDQAGLVLSGVVDRSVSTLLMPDVLERMLKARLRDEAGAAYAPWSTYQPVDADHAVLFAGSDVTPKLLPKLAGEVTGLIGRIKESGLPREFIDDAKVMRIQMMQDPYNVSMMAYAAAHRVLHGREPESLGEVISEIQDATPESLQPLATQFATSLLLGIDGDAAWDDEMPRLELTTHAPAATGRKFRHRDWPAVGDELRIADDRVEIVSGDQARSMAYSEVEGMMAFADGGRYLVDADGWSLGIEPTTWRNGQAATALVDKNVSLQRTLLQPHRELEAEKRMPLLKRLWRAMERKPRTRKRAVIVSIVMAAVVISLVVYSRGGGLLAIFAGIWIYQAIKATAPQPDSNQGVSQAHGDHGQRDIQGPRQDREPVGEAHDDIASPS